MAESKKINIKKHFNLVVKLPIMSFTIALFAILSIFEYRNSINQKYLSLINFENNALNHAMATSDMHLYFKSYLSTGEKEFLNLLNDSKKEKNTFLKKIETHSYIDDDQRYLNTSLESTKVWEEQITNLVNLKASSKENIDSSLSSQLDSLFTKYGKTSADIRTYFSKQKNKLKQKNKNLRIFSIVLTLLLGLLFSGFVYFFVRKKILFISKHYNQLIRKKDRQKKELLEVSKSKDLFLANMSHEIRTPLGAIIGFANLAYEDPNLESKAKENIGFVKRNSEHLLGLIEDLFDLTKIGNDKLDLNLEKSDLYEILKDIESTFQEKTQELKQDLIFKIIGELPKKIVTDQLRLKQILTNLIGNAIKFSPPGKKITCELEDSDGTLEINIIDQGIGIAKDKANLIYDSFEQVDTEHSRIFGGAGLGLSISKNLTQLLGGHLELVWSEKGQGSHFKLSFPIKTVGGKVFNHLNFVENQSKLAEPTDSDIFDFSEALSGKEVLIAEDSKKIKSFFGSLLKEPGQK